ncbi:hypothetical protein BATDEDRAFT_86546 [Batrachochytrium dendrobatidis JAM81]|uniref:Uncharacterized protein n=2 Tax=Batrachochytrium dendrobatidis TaxID=109871 RepID=F4NX27_BATDJ|nr:uncharacterized protein BATDEDRAFT_86546 [Batrachochytrium dendrobatidis JAM81]EGF82601.1 hypothetical protein BATDEDRAFT_86546 [Batrachochytrium dendrobatidis JAM81]OAJ40061.1 hypothetical protein BDEG_23840 [Batrachochytrium dendrobatidis JEL423]|eukprot:XP_006676983.1 hypothetical protein BATDEDRAFT_86546 [Batrachochytrium dendrobatidis JAM81]
MENERFYIKYLDYQPVEIETHFNGELERKRPLDSVSKLIAAFQALPNSPLASAFVGDLTIHFVVDGPAIPGNTLLTSIQHPVGFYDQPLVIKSGIVHGPTVGINDFVRKGIPTYWKVSGALSDSLAVKGVCSRMYRNADNYLGYYESGQPAFFYEENKPTLKINVLFETKENALRFDSHLRNESITINSPMNSLTINSSVSTTSTAQLGERIYYKDYIPTDSELPQDTQSVITIQFSTFEKTSDEFKYQRIEKLSIFGSMGKAESCHLISDSHCRNYPSYEKYDKDPNNRLAMSMDLHGWFINLSTEIPLFYLKIVSISDSVIVEDRYKVVLAVVALNQESADMIFYRLIEGSTKTDNPLIMNTSVHVTNPTIFRKCLEWKEKETMKKWDDYYSMDSAVP